MNKTFHFDFFFRLIFIGMIQKIRHNNIIYLIKVF